MKTRILIALIAAIVALSACKKEETVPVNEFTFHLTGDMKTMTYILANHTKYKLYSQERSITIHVPSDQKIYYFNRFGNGQLNVVLNGINHTTIQLSEDDRNEYELPMVFE